MRAADRAQFPVDAAETTRLFKPLTRFGRLALAVSGGADSVALLRLAVDWRQAVPDAPDLRVLTVDHGLRPGSATEARQVAEWAHAHGLPCCILTWSRDGTRGNLQAEARAARYRLMAQACHDAKIGAVVTAHHLDDQAETFMLRLARGSGVDGLGAMSEASRIFGMTVLRPLLDVPHARLVATLHAMGQPFISDPSNESPAFARVRMRAMSQALASEGLTPRRLAATARRMRRARVALDAATDTLADEVASLDPLGFCTLNDNLAAAADDIALRLLSRIVMAVSGCALQPSEAALERLLALVRAGGNGGMTLSGCRMNLTRTGAVFFRETGRRGLPELRLAPGEAHIWDGRFVASLAVGAPMLDLRPLRADGIAAIRRCGGSLRLKSRIAATCPSLWHGDRLVFAPQIINDGSDFGESGLAEMRALGRLRHSIEDEPEALHTLTTMF